MLSLSWEPARPQSGLAVSGAYFVCEPPAEYRPRRPETTAHYQLLERYFDDYVFAYEERFESTSGPLRSVVSKAVMAYLACGRPGEGFARLRCPDCLAERILAFSCRTPSERRFLG